MTTLSTLHLHFVDRFDQSRLFLAHLHLCIGEEAVRFFHFAGPHQRRGQTHGRVDDLFAATGELAGRLHDLEARSLLRRLIGGAQFLDLGLDLLEGADRSQFHSRWVRP